MVYPPTCLRRYGPQPPEEQPTHLPAHRQKGTGRKKKNRAPSWTSPPVLTNTYIIAAFEWLAVCYDATGRTGGFVSRIGIRVAAVGAGLVLLAACSSSSKTGQGATSTTVGSVGSAGGSKPTITIGVITDLSGPASNTSQFTPDGIKAGVALAAHEGYNVKVDTVDSATNPTSALNAAKQLVQQDHVFAVVGLSAVFFAAAPYLASQGVPVIGGDYDGTEWLTTPSMFSVFPYEDFSKVSTATGEIVKMLGGTNLATLGYSISPSSADTAKAYGVSAQDAGIKAGYVNANVPFGTTNVGPLVLAMKSAGIDSVDPVTDTNTGLAVIVGLRQQGVKLKVAILSEVEGDLLAGGSAAEQQSTGAYLGGLYTPAAEHPGDQGAGLVPQVRRRNHHAPDPQRVHGLSVHRCAGQGSDEGGLECHAIVHPGHGRHYRLQRPGTSTHPDQSRGGRAR